MAKIPSFSQNNRLSQGGAQQAVSVDAAGQRGESIAKFGAQVQRFGDQMNQYFAEKNKVDNALYAADVRNKLILKGQEGFNFAETNPDSARDGSTVQQDFGTVFNPLKEDIKNVEDRNKRAIGLQVLNDVEKSYRDKLMTYQIKKHNSFVLEKSTDILNGYSFRVQNDPSQTGQVLREFDAMANQMPFEGKNKTNFMQSGRRSIVTAAIDSFAEKGDFQSARAIVSSTDAGNLYSSEERRKQIDYLNARERTEANFKYSQEQHEHTKMKQEKAEIQEQVEEQLFTRLVNASTPAERTEILRDAQVGRGDGLLSRTGYSALLANQDKIDSAQSTSVKGGYAIEFYNDKPVEEIKQRILADMSPGGRLSTKDGLALIATLNRENKKEKSDPAYKEQKKLAKDYIMSRLNPGGFNSWGILAGRQEKAMAVDIGVEAAKQEAAGKSPMEAARIATAKVIGVQQLDLVDGVNNSVKDLQEYQVTVKKRYLEAQKRGQVTNELKQRTEQALRESLMRIERLKQQEEYDKILKIEGK